VRLGELLGPSCVPVPEGLAGLEVTGLENDSRRVAPGFLFVAVRGFTEDGHAYAARAIEAGASAVLAERPLEMPSCIVNPRGDNRRLLGEIAARFYGRPWESLVVVGVTGTNGKTSTAHMIRWMLERQGLRCGLLGTVGHIVAGREVAASETTPDALALARLFSGMAEGGDAAAVMEVSSHALALSRVEEIRFDAAVFTNITQDHLDFHSSMDGYLRAKMHLLDLLKPSGKAVFGTYAPGWPEVSGAVTFGTSPGSAFRICGLTCDPSGISFDIQHEGDSARVSMATPARVNAYNSAGAIAACVTLGLPMAECAAALAGFPGVPGRLEIIGNDRGFLVAVDYAHTPDALERVLRQAREFTRNRLAVVFGAGGDRDRAKRPRMGAIAARLADRVVVTSDNPRTEDPLSIIGEILAGIPSGCGTVSVESDRRKAIRMAVEGSLPGDVVIIAGKGHEDYQIVGHTRSHFDDREEARAALEAGS
jgi:UDP-N-acetylmuramoyl-L-alanyl-D-glutamate--2,6-diaminopimelate ligase